MLRWNLENRQLGERDNNLSQRQTGGPSPPIPGIEGGEPSPEACPCGLCASSKKSRPKSAERVRCLARWQRHSRAPAWCVRCPPMAVRTRARLSFTVTDLRQLNGPIRAIALMQFSSWGCVAGRGRRAVVSDRSEGSKCSSVTRLARQKGLGAPKVLEAAWCQLSITHCRLNAAVPEISL